MATLSIGRYRYQSDALFTSPACRDRAAQAILILMFRFGNFAQHRIDTAVWDRASLI